MCAVCNMLLLQLLFAQFYFVSQMRSNFCLLRAALVNLCEPAAASTAASAAAAAAVLPQLQLKLAVAWPVAVAVAVPQLQPRLQPRLHLQRLHKAA